MWQQCDSDDWSELGRAVNSTSSSSARQGGGRVYAPRQFSERSELMRVVNSISIFVSAVGRRSNSRPAAVQRMV